MSTVEDIEDAVAALAPNDFARFRAWFDGIAADRFDEAIAKDVANGRLDTFATEALDDARKNRTRPL